MSDESFDCCLVVASFSSNIPSFDIIIMQHKCNIGTLPRKFFRVYIALVIATQEGATKVATRVVPHTRGEGPNDSVSERLEMFGVSEPRPKLPSDLRCQILPRW